MRAISLLLAATLVIPNPALPNQEPTSANAQLLPQRDFQALAILQGSIRAMGGSVPSDSAATGAITIVAGTKSESGTITVLTRGLDQSAEHIISSERDQTLVYSRGFAAEIQNGTKAELSLELAASSHSPVFPLAVFAAALDSDWSAQYFGLEDSPDGRQHHIRVWNTYSSKADFAPLAEFSVKDFWFDSVSLLPTKLAYEQRAAKGPEELRIRKEIFFSDYRTVGGILYPFAILESFNGTPWTTITIQKVTLNSALSDTEFSVE